MKVAKQVIIWESSEYKEDFLSYFVEEKFLQNFCEKFNDEVLEILEIDSEDEIAEISEIDTGEIDSSLYPVYLFPEQGDNNDKHAYSNQDIMILVDAVKRIEYLQSSILRKIIFAKQQELEKANSEVLKLQERKNNCSPEESSKKPIVSGWHDIDYSINGLLDYNQRQIRTLTDEIIKLESIINNRQQNES